MLTCCPGIEAATCRRAKRLNLRLKPPIPTTHKRLRRPPCCSIFCMHWSEAGRCGSLAEFATLRNLYGDKLFLVLLPRRGRCVRVLAHSDGTSAVEAQASYQHKSSLSLRVVVLCFSSHKQTRHNEETSPAAEDKQRQFDHQNGHHADAEPRGRPDPALRGSQPALMDQVQRSPSLNFRPRRLTIPDLSSPTKPMRSKRITCLTVSLPTQMSLLAVSLATLLSSRARSSRLFVAVEVDE